MSMSANLHGLATVKADSHSNTAWLSLYSSDGDYVAVFMPLHVAQAMESAFNAAMEPKPATEEAA